MSQYCLTAHFRQQGESENRARELAAQRSEQLWAAFYGEQAEDASTKPTRRGKRRGSSSKQPAERAGEAERAPKVRLKSRKRPRSPLPATPAAPLWKRDPKDPDMDPDGSYGKTLTGLFELAVNALQRRGQ